MWEGASFTWEKIILVDLTVIIHYFTKKPASRHNIDSQLLRTWANFGPHQGSKLDVGL